MTAAAKGESKQARTWRRYPSYKPSGVEWLGDVPEGWGLSKIKFQSDVNMGQSPNSEDCNIDGDGIPFLQGTAEFGSVNPLPKQYCKIAKKTAKKDQILISVRAPVGDINIADQEYGIGRGLSSINCYNSDFNDRYCWYLLHHVRIFLIINSYGSTYDAVTVEDVKNINIPLPITSEQTTIAAFLDRETARIDTLIAKKERQIELLQEKRIALISHSVTKGLNPNINMKDSGVAWIGDVPEHWEILKNKWIYQEIDQRSISGEEELLTVSHITGVTPRSEKNVNMFLPLSFEGYKLCKTGDLAINTMWAFMGALGFSPCDGIVSPSYNVYRFKEKKVSKYFDYLYRTPAFMCEILKYSNGVWTSRLRLYPEEFLSITSPNPPVDEQKKIVQHINSIIEKEKVQIKKIQQSIDFLKEYRSALISAAVTGKIDVLGEVKA